MAITENMAYPYSVEISGAVFRCNTKKQQIEVPYTDAPDVHVGQILDVIKGTQTFNFKVLDLDFAEEGTLKIGTRHPHLLILEVQNLTSSAHRPQKSQTNFHIGSISGEQVQLGDGNTINVNITIQQLAEKIARSDDPKAKGLLRQLLENSTVASVVGAGATALVGLL